MSLDIVNNGAFNISEAYLTLNVDDTLIKVESLDDKSEEVLALASKNKILEGRSLTSKGDKLRIDADLSAKNIFLSEQQQTRVSAKFCYNYETRLTFYDFCLDPIIVPERERQVVCTYQSQYNTGSQGAPLSIHSVEFLRQPEGDSIIPIFYFYVSNNQRGNIVSNDSVRATCGLEGKVEQNKIEVKAWLGDEQLSCEEFIFDPKRTDNNFKCEGNFVTESVPVKIPLFVNLGYGYVDNVDKTITIEKSERFI
jgi:hypothetical protein